MHFLLCCNSLLCWISAILASSHWQLSPCFTLSAVLIVIGMSNPQVLLVIPIPIPVKTCTCTGTHEYGFLQILTWVSRVQCISQVSSTTCAMQWRGKVIWRSSLCLEVKYISVLTESLVGAAQYCGCWSNPLPCVPSPFPFSVSISCNIAWLSAVWFANLLDWTWVWVQVHAGAAPWTSVHWVHHWFFNSCSSFNVRPDWTSFLHSHTTLILPNLLEVLDTLKSSSHCPKNILNMLIPPLYKRCLNPHWTGPQTV